MSYTSTYSRQAKQLVSASSTAAAVVSKTKNFMQSFAACAGTCISGLTTHSLVTHAHTATHVESALVWSLLALLGAALTACLAHLTLVLSLTFLIRSTGTHTMLGHSLFILLKVLAPKAARNILIAGTTAGCVMALAASPSHAQEASQFDNTSSATAISSTADVELTRYGLGFGETQTSASTASHSAQEDASLPSLGWGNAHDSSDQAASAAKTMHGASGGSMSAAYSARHNSHTVTKGDTLWAIATEHLGDADSATHTADVASEVRLIVSANPQVKDPNLIYPGQTLTIPHTQEANGQ